MKKNAFLILLLCLLQQTMLSQTEEDKYWLNLSFDNNQYGSIINRPFENMLSVNPASFRASVERYLGKNWNLETGLLLGKIGTPIGTRANLFALELMPKLKLGNGLIFKESSSLKPFVGLGVGFVNFSNSDIDTDTDNKSGLLLSPAVGLEYYAGDAIKIFVSTAYRIGGNEDEGINYRQYSLGIGFSLKKKIDADGDGVPDKKDACPDQPGTKAYKGCPAPLVTDQPVTDEQPAETIKPTEEEPVRTDTTKTRAETPVEAKDSDGDGIPDHMDLCPDEAGTDERVGCPESAGKAPLQESPVATESVYTLPIDAISFGPGTGRINRSELVRLEELATLMKNDESFKLELTGYGDRGNDAATNFQLAIERVAAVKSYLLNKGISPYRFISNVIGPPTAFGTSGKVLLKVIE